MVELSVNVNKVALLRNSRGGDEPNVLAMARIAMDHGAYGITVHPRPDLRHIRPSDVRDLARMLRTEYPGAEFNIEGNPFAPANEHGYPGLLALVEETRPDQCTLVPDSDEQLTSDHGFDIARDGDRLLPLVTRLKQCSARVALFMDAESADAMREVRTIGADRIELYTGPYATEVAANPTAETTSGNEITQANESTPPNLTISANHTIPLNHTIYAAACAPFARAARAATAAGLGVNAGHDLNLINLPAFAAISGLLEVSIGHALIGDALLIGMGPAVARYVAVLRRANLTRALDHPG